MIIRVGFLRHDSALEIGAGSAAISVRQVLFTRGAFPSGLMVRIPHHERVLKYGAPKVLCLMGSASLSSNRRHSASLIPGKVSCLCREISLESRSIRENHLRSSGSSSHVVTTLPQTRAMISDSLRARNHVSSFDSAALRYVCIFRDWPPLGCLKFGS